MHRCVLSETNIPLKESASMAVVVEAPHLSEEELFLFVYQNKETEGNHVKPEGFGLPGGTRKSEESSIQCAVRECLQETGVDPEAVAKAAGSEISWLSYQHSLLDRRRDPPYVSCKKIPEMLENREFFLDKESINPEEQTQTFVNIYSFRVTDWQFFPEAFRNVFEMRSAYKPEEELIIDVSPDLAEVLGIVEAMAKGGMAQEITKLALFRKSYLLGWFEEWKAYCAAKKRGERPDWSRKGEFYTSHILRIMNLFGKSGPGRPR